MADKSEEKKENGGGGGGKLDMAKYPFLDGLKPEHYPTGRKKELQKIRTWLQTQPHLPAISDEFIYLFLHSNYWNVERSKMTMEAYFTLRGQHRMIFADRDPYQEKMVLCTELAYGVGLPDSTPEGYRVLLYKIKEGGDYTKVLFSDAVKAFCSYNDCVISEAGLAEGYVIVFDMKGLQLGHLARVSLPVLKAFLAYIQDAHPARVKAIHVLNTANYINHILRIATPLVRSEMMSLVKFYSGNVPDGVPLEIMPSDYGGKAPAVPDLFKEHLSLMGKYRQYLMDSERYVTDESKRPKKTTWWGFFTGSNSAQELETKNRELFGKYQID